MSDKKMRIFVCENLPMFVDHLVPALKEIGYSAVSRRDFGQESVAKILRAFRPDIVLTVGWTPSLSPVNLKSIRSYCRMRKAFHVYWSLEDPIHMDTWSMRVIRMGQPDYVFSHDPDVPLEYERLGIPSSQLMHACNPRLHRPSAPHPNWQHDIILVANFSYATEGSLRKTSVETLLLPLIDEGLDVAVYGRHWKERFSECFARPLPETVLKEQLQYEDVPYAYASAKIVLGLQNEERQLTRRTFEALTCGSCLITLHTKGVLEHFKHGTHVLLSRTPRETVQLVRHALRHEKKRERLGRSGRHWFVPIIRTSIA